MYVLKQGILFYSGTYPLDPTPTPTATPTPTPTATPTQSNSSAILSLRAGYSSYTSGYTLDLGDYETGFPATITLTLNGDDTLNVTSVTSSNPDFSIEWVYRGPAPVDVGIDEATLNVRNAGLVDGPHSTTVTIIHDGSNTPFTLNLTINFVTYSYG